MVKITVLKTTLDKELAAEYGVPGLKACPMLREGQTFLADYAKPDGLCDEAWKAIYQYVFALAHREPGDGSLFYYGDWIRKPGVAHLQLQRRPAPRHFQAGDHRRGRCARIYARSLIAGDEKRERLSAFPFFVCLAAAADMETASCAVLFLRAAG